MGATETILIEVTGDSQGAAAMLAALYKEFDRLAKEVQGLNKTSSGAGAGLDALTDQTQLLAGGTEEAAGATGGLSSMLALVDPVSAAAAMALEKVVGVVKSLVDWLKKLWPEILATADASQQLDISMAGIATRDIVRAGDFDKYEDVLGTANLAAEGMVKTLEDIALQAPYANEKIIDTFKELASYGWAVDNAVDLTEAMLTLGTATGNTGYGMDIIRDALADVNRTGEITEDILGDLKNVGLDLAAVLQDELGVSVEDFNKQMESGELTMNQFAQAVGGYVEDNFAGAADELAHTVKGIRASLQNLREISLKRIFAPAINVLSEPIADALAIINQLVVDSGVLEKAGAFLERAARGIVALINSIAGFIGPAVAKMAAGLKELGAFQDVIPRLRIIGGQIAEIAKKIYQLLLPAFLRLIEVIGGANWEGMLLVLGDTVNAVLSVIEDMLTAIDLVLQGRMGEAVAPLENAFITALTAVALLFDVFVGRMFVWGRNLIVQLANGIMAAAQSVLQAALTWVGNMISRFFEPGSPPKEGPLRHIVEWGRGLMEVFLESFKLADFGILKSVLAPLEQAFRDAFAAGDISEVEYLEQFMVVREQITGLIADFRETGEINQDILADISKGLGEGGRELVKYLELQLRYQQATERLLAVQEDVAAAQSAGFVSKDLQDRLALAEAEADALADQVSWQRELISLQRESVDLQLRLIKAIEALSKAGAGAGGAGGAGGAAGAGLDIPAIPPAFAGGIETFLPEKAPKKGGPKITELEGFSDYFETMRLKVQAFIDAPLEGKIDTIAAAITDLTGIDVSGWWDTMKDGYDNLKKFLDLEPAAKVDALAWAFEELTGIDVATPIEKNRLAWETLSNYIDEHGLPSFKEVKDFVVDKLAPAFVTFTEEKAAKFLEGLTSVKDYMSNDFQPAIETLRDFVRDELGPKIIALAEEYLPGLVTGFTTVWTFVTEDLLPGLTDLRDFIRDELGPTIGTFKTGKVDKLNEGFGFIKTAIDDAKEAAEKFLTMLANAIIPWWARGHSPPPMANWFSDIGSSIEMASAELSVFGSTLGNNISKSNLALSQAAVQAGGVVFIQDGMNFPNVRDGKDAVSVRRELKRMAEEASAYSKVKGVRG